MDAISLLNKFINIPTEQPHPDYALAIDFLKSVCLEKLPGCQFDVHEYVDGKPNLIVKVFGETSSVILLSCHMDVVPQVVDEHPNDPSPSHPTREKVIVGRGSQDMKSIGIAYIEAVSRLLAQQSPLRKSIHLVFTVDEEIGSKHGMQSLVKHGAFKDTNIDIVLDEGAPSPFPFIVIFNGERFTFPVRIVIPGQGGHGSAFVEDGAAEKLSVILSRICEFKSLQKGKLKDLLDLGKVITVNANVIRGGVQVNVIPTLFELQVDIRVPPDVKVKEIETIVNGWIDGMANVQWTRLIPDDNACTNLTNPDNQYLKTVQQLLKDKCQIDSRVAIFPGATDCRFLRAVGCDAINISPFRNTQILLHDKDEHLSEDVFKEAIDIYEHIIRAFCDI